MTKSAKTQLSEFAKAQLGWKQKLAVYVLWQWAKEDGMDFLKQLVKLQFLDGYRMYLSGFASILGGLTLILLFIANDPRGQLENGMAAVVAGIAIIGKAGKDEKLIEATKAVAVVTAAANPEVESVTAVDAEVAIAKISEANKAVSTPVS